MWERGQLENRILYGRVGLILKSLFKNCGADKDGVDLDQDWYKWRILVNAVINLAFHKTRRIFWLTEELVAFQQGLCSTDWVSLIIW